MISDALAHLVSLVMQIPVGFEWLILVLVIIVLFFGVKKIPALARSIGRARTEYEKSKIEAKRELQSIKSNYKSSDGSNTDDRQKLEEIAETLGIEHSNKNNQELRAAIEAEIAKGKDA
jgi:sec-independent protein translocase protein TatA